MWDLKYGTDELIYHTEIDSQTWGTDLLPGGERWREELAVRDW